MSAVWEPPFPYPQEETKSLPTSEPVLEYPSIAPAWSPDWDNQMSPPIVQAPQDPVQCHCQWCSTPGGSVTCSSSQRRSHPPEQPQPRPQSKGFGTNDAVAEPGGDRCRYQWCTHDHSSTQPSEQPQPRPESKGFTTGRKVTLAVVVGLAVLLGIVFLASGPAHSQKWKDCVHYNQGVVDGSPGNTQKDLEELCEVMVGP